MANKRSFYFIIAFHNFATLENRLTYINAQVLGRLHCHYNEEEIHRHLKKKKKKRRRILAGPN
jgi:hypothetical protein